VAEVYGIPVGVVGRIVSGTNEGLFVEVDDDTQRPNGTGGFYVLLWSDTEGYDEWYEKATDLPLVFEHRQVEWLTPQESASIPGRHRHDEM
jgi:hypothetical protein